MTNEIPSDALVLRRFEWIPPFATPRVISAQFPRTVPVISVERLLAADGQLWAAIRPRSDANLASGRGRLWSYSDARGLLEPVRGALEIHSVNALAADTRRLWMALNGGLAAMEFGSGVVDAYGPAQGFLSTDVAGVGFVDGTVVALGRYGVLWGLVAGSSSFIRAAEAAPSDNPRSPSAWNGFTTSGDWMAAYSDTSVALRHRRGAQWLMMRDELANGTTRIHPPRFQCLSGDGEGGFWVGSEHGLHWINPESNVVENRFAPLTVTIPGGLGMRVAAGFKASPAAYEMARQRVIGQIRERMRDRARYARESAGLKQPINPVMPTSRLPGGVTALCRDGQLLWIAASDGQNTNRSRVLLLHQPSRRWLGWFAVGAPIQAIAADPQRVWLGLDITRSPGMSPLLVVDRPPLVSVPQTKWVKDYLSPEELGKRLASLPVKERAVLAFFGGEPAKVEELLAPDGVPPADADPETLFLLAFAYDLVGLNDPDRLDRYVALLKERFPNSLYTELVGGVRSARPAERVDDEITEPAPEAPVEPPAVELPSAPASPEPAVVAPEVARPEPVSEPKTVTPEISATAESAASPAVEVEAISPEDSIRIEVILKKRDLNRDGTLNAVEFKLWLGQKADFRVADTNRDGKVDSIEIRDVLRQQDAAPAPQ